MKRLIIKSIAIILFSVAISVPIMVLMPDMHSRNSHEVNVALAYHRLDSLRNTNKIVIIAGSNGGFSMNSKIISDSLHMPVVNTATHASIGVRMQFEMYKEFLKNGDVVIFCPEYGSDKGRLYGDKALFRILSTHMPEAYLKINCAQWKYLYKYAGLHFAEATRRNIMTSTKFLLFQAINMFKHENRSVVEGPYAATSVNKYGDIAYPRYHQDKIEIYNLKGTMDKDVLSYYQYIHNYCKGKGIKLVYLPPTVILSMYSENEAQIDSLSNLVSSNGIPFQAKPSRYTFPDSLYFDTPYHMTSKGADIRTYRVVEDLKRILCK